MNHNNFYLSQRLGSKLLEFGLKLAVAESCTGGGLAQQITAVPGSSQWFDCGFVTYSDLSKIAMLGVNPLTIQGYGAVSQETAHEMAVQTLVKSTANLALSITGIAGPGGGSAEKPVGTVWFGLAHKGRRCATRQQCFTGGRNQIRDCSIEFALKWMLEELSR